MDLSPQQAAAYGAVQDWLSTTPDQRAPWYYLAGYAGTGKTSIAKRLASEVGGQVLFASFTGKAALCMRRAGCEDATTLHRLAYTCGHKSEERLAKLEAGLAELREAIRLGRHDRPAEGPEEVAYLEREIRAEKKHLRSPSWHLNPESPIKSAPLLVVDECSMVGERLAQDLLSFQTPLLVLGDPAQLPPVGSSGYFTRRDPDALLTEVHRQALDSPVLCYATLVRQGENLPYGRDGDSAVLQRDDVRTSHLLDYDQVVCGRNATRRRVNANIRALHGFKDLIPQKGDRLVCLRNDHDAGLLNGSTWAVEECRALGDDLLYLEVYDDEGAQVACQAHTAHFTGGEVDPRRRRDAQEFDYGYVLTAHKSQGSQWRSVAVLDESGAFRDDAQRWLYTAITRASDRVLVVR